MKTYTIKPLEWEQDPIYSLKRSASTPMGRLQIFAPADARGKWWRVYLDEDVLVAQERTEAIAIASAQRWHDARLMQALVEVKP